MGAWGTGNFENDAALDWLDLELGAHGASAVSAALQNVISISETDYLEVDIGSWALAAAETVSISIGNGPKDVSNEVLKDIKKHVEAITAIPSIEKVTLKAIARILGNNSELNQLWTQDNAVGDETGNEWLAVVADLQARLRK